MSNKNATSGWVDEIKTAMLRKLALVLVLSVQAMSGKGQVYFDGLYGQTATADGIPTGGTIETPNGYLVLSTEYDGQDNHYAFFVDVLGQFQYGFYIEENDTIGEFGGSVLRYSDTLLIGMAQWRNLNQPSTVSGDLMLTGFKEDGTIYWRKKYGEELRGEYPISYMITNDGGFAVVGQVAVYTEPEIDGQLYLMKIDAIGNFQWEKSFGGNNNETGSDLLQTPDHGFLLLGWTRSFGNGQRDFYLVKTDSLGEQEWQQTYGDEGFDSGSSIIALSDGNYLLAGYRNLSERRQGYMYKIDPIGTIIWENEYGESNTTEEFNKVIELPNGDIVAAGLYDPYGASVQQSDNGGLLVKVDSEGNELWRRTYQENENTDLFYSVLLAEDGGFLLSGQARNAETGSQDAWLLKVDSVGCPYPNCLVGVDEVEPSKIMVDVWPNPTSQVLNIELQQQGTAEVQLYDMAGKLMLQKQTTQLREIIDVSALENGLYLLSVLQGDMKTTVKVMVW